MHDFHYVTRTEAKPVRDELVEIILQVQDEIRHCFTFQFRPVGSSVRNMITRDRNSNTGFDFDFDLEINDDEEAYGPQEIRSIIRNAIDRIALWYGYKHCEDSTRVLTLKKVNVFSCSILHSCDFVLVYNCRDGMQQYIRYNKRNQTYTWEFQGRGFKDLEWKTAWLKADSRYWGDLRDYYLYKKNFNDNPNKHSRSIFAESVNEMYREKSRLRQDSSGR